MKIPTKKLKCGFEMPVLGLGTWMMGGDKIRDPNNDDRSDIEAVRKAIDMGITHIDTAEVYAEGYSEKIVGSAIKGYKRKELFLASKVFKNNLGYTDLKAACKRSLERVETEYLDLYMIHSPNDHIPIEESMKALNELKAEGVIRNIGVSNFTNRRLDKAQAVSDAKIVANQVHYNLMVREIEEAGIVRYCQDNDVMLVAWRPVQKGLLCKRGEYEVLDKIALKYNKTPAQIAINWLISQKNIVTLSKMASESHLEENLRALDWEMKKDDIELLKREFPEKMMISDAVPLI